MHKYAHPIHIFIIHLMHQFHHISYRILLNTTFAIFSVFIFDEGRSLWILLSQKPFTFEPSLLYQCVIYIFVYKTVPGFVDAIFHFSFVACLDKSFGFLCGSVLKSIDLNFGLRYWKTLGQFWRTYHAELLIAIWRLYVQLLLT